MRSAERHSLPYFPGVHLAAQPDLWSNARNTIFSALNVTVLEDRPHEASSDDGLRPRAGLCRERGRAERVHEWHAGNQRHLWHDRLEHDYNVRAVAPEFERQHRDRDRLSRRLERQLDADQRLDERLRLEQLLRLRLDLGDDKRQRIDERHELRHDASKRYELDLGDRQHERHIAVGSKRHDERLEQRIDGRRLELQAGRRRQQQAAEQRR
jgi:hypothetical protein